MENIGLLFDQEIDVGLPRSGYRLIPGYAGHLGLPVEVFLRLYAVKGDEKRLIANPGDLSGIVTSIDDEDAAWRFLHLFTSPDTHYLFQKGAYTIDLALSPDGTVAGVGMISRDVNQQIGYRAPEMVLEDREYVSSRDLIRANSVDRSAFVDVIRRRESVSEGGRYRFIEDKAKGRIARSDVPFPSYE